MDEEKLNEIVQKYNVYVYLPVILKDRYKDFVRNNCNIFIFPEGTRNQGDELLTFKQGSFKMAEKTGCPIIPVAFSNTDAVFEHQQPWVKKAHVIVEYGKPIDINTLSKEARKNLGSMVQEIVSEMIQANNKLI